MHPGFLPQCKDVHVTLTGSSKLSVGVRLSVRLSLCLSVMNWLTCPACNPAPRPKNSRDRPHLSAEAVKMIENEGLDIMKVMKLTSATVFRVRRSLCNTHFTFHCLFCLRGHLIQKGSRAVMKGHLVEGCGKYNWQTPSPDKPSSFLFGGLTVKRVILEEFEQTATSSGLL